MTSIAKLSEHRSSDPPTVRDIVLLQAPIVQTLNLLLDRPEAHSAMLTGIVLVAGQENAIEHKLGRKWRGWFLADRNADARVWSTAAPARITDTHLTLEASAAVTVSLVVF